MTVATYYPPGTRPVIQAAGAVGLAVAKAGHLIYVFGRILMSIPVTLRYYQREFLRVLSDIAWGNGSIVVGGGTVGVALVLGVAAGAMIGVEGYNALNLLGLGPATGLLSSFGSTREFAPVMIGLAFITQAGCRFTAQLGAMRIADEIDALEAMAIQPIPYLVTTRVAASVVAAIPLFLVCLAVTYWSCQLVVSVSSGQSSGTYLHYFGLFMSGRDVVFAMIKAVVFVFVSSTIQCYYGYFASGGPEGVGVAAGRAMRASITVVIILNTLLTMALWGVDTGARFGG
ncbi:ABC transporter permease [Mycobacteroides salmoniphilum]|uniref:ABC transporter permease n=1 Tax=Mycobacteroides salmoniphilum TaxID=404941 RepID=UPI0010E4A5B8|nr:ABC transporter permease [Mycobacteroides salmoniphilum]TDZ99333.1 putative phospholipid ABC transporter permease protein MlaE [Mycobacteroides salmoniphilum]